MVNLMIQLPEETLEYIKKNQNVGGWTANTVVNAINNGITLPNRVADADAVVDGLKGVEKLYINDELRSNILDIINSNVLVEADKIGGEK